MGLCLDSDMSGLFTLSATSLASSGEVVYRYKTVTYHPRHDGWPKQILVVGWLVAFPPDEGWYLLVKSHMQELSAEGTWPTLAEIFERGGHAGPFVDEDAALVALRIML